MEMAFLFFKALPSKESELMKGKKSPQKDNTNERKQM